MTSESGPPRAKQIESILQAHESLQEENELLLLQLHQVQEELERYYLRNLELEGTTPVSWRQEEKPSVKDLERRVQRIENSTSWRLTAPLRLFSQMLSRKKGSSPPPDAWAPEEKQIRYLQRRIERLETSTSWKITAPLRSIGLIFRGQAGAPKALLPSGQRKLALEEAQKKIATLESQLAGKSTSRRKAEQLAQTLEGRLAEESTSRRKAEQLAQTLEGRLAEESKRIDEEAEARKTLEERLSKVTADEGFYTRRYTLLQIDLDNLRERFAESERQRTQQEALLRKLTPRLAQAAQELKKLRIMPAPTPTALGETEPAQIPDLPETDEPRKTKGKGKRKA